MRLFVFAASLRKNSFNKKLASLIARKLEDHAVDVEHGEFR